MRSNRSAENVKPCSTRAEKGDPSCAFKAVPIVPSGFGLQREDSTADMKPFVLSDHICKPTAVLQLTIPVP